MIAIELPCARGDNDSLRVADEGSEVIVSIFTVFPEGDVYLEADRARQLRDYLTQWLEERG